MSGNSIELVQTRIGQPHVIGQDRHGADIWSSIGRLPLPAGVSEVYLTWTGVAGDQPTETRPKTATESAPPARSWLQSLLRVLLRWAGLSAGGGSGQIHGGHDKAVYVYPEEHYPRWLAELGEDGLGARSLGENWSIQGATEADVHIGDIWELGEARLRVSKVRTPCSTLQRYFGRRDMIQRMRDNGLCGWYLEVLRPGTIPTRGHIRVVSRNLNGPTVAQVFAGKMKTKAGV